MIWVIYSVCFLLKLLGLATWFTETKASSSSYEEASKDISGRFLVASYDNKAEDPLLGIAVFEYSEYSKFSEILAFKENVSAIKLKQYANMLINYEQVEL